MTEPEVPDFDLARWREPLPDNFRFWEGQMVPIYVAGFNDMEGWILINRLAVDEFMSLNHVPPAALLQ